MVGVASTRMISAPGTRSLLMTGDTAAGMPALTVLSVASRTSSFTTTTVTRWFVCSAAGRVMSPPKSVMISEPASAAGVPVSTFTALPSTQTDTLAPFCELLTVNFLLPEMAPSIWMGALAGSGSHESATFFAAADGVTGSGVTGAVPAAATIVFAGTTTPSASVSGGVVALLSATTGTPSTTTAPAKTSVPFTMPKAITWSSAFNTVLKPPTKLRSSLSTATCRCSIGFPPAGFISFSITCQRLSEAFPLTTDEPALGLSSVSTHEVATTFRGGGGTCAITWPVASNTLSIRVNG